MLPRLVKLLLGIFLLSACASVRLPVDSILDTTPEAAATAAWLAAHLDLNKPVEVRDAELLEQGLYGQSWILEDRYMILLDPRLPEPAKTMVLVHEMAHCLVWSRGGTSSDHGVEWGDAYSAVFKVSVGEQ